MIYAPQLKEIDLSSIDEAWICDVKWEGVMEKLKADGLAEEEPKGGLAGKIWNE